MTITRRRKHLNQQFSKKSKAQDIPHHLAVSNQDLKQFSKSDLLGFAAYEIFEKTSVNTSVNTSANTPVNTSLNTPVNTSVNALVNAPVFTSGNTSVNTSVNTPVNTSVNTSVNTPVPKTPVPTAAPEE